MSNFYTLICHTSPLQHIFRAENDSLAEIEGKRLSVLMTKASNENLCIFQIEGEIPEGVLKYWKVELGVIITDL